MALPGTHQWAARPGAVRSIPREPAMAVSGRHHLTEPWLRAMHRLRLAQSDRPDVRLPWQRQPALAGCYRIRNPAARGATGPYSPDALPTLIQIKGLLARPSTSITPWY